MRPFKSMDANAAAAHVAYAFTEVAAIYPITPSSPMAEHVDEWANQNRKNLFGHEVNIVEMESEAGAAGTVHGSLSTGALTTTFTASQGLLLMIPNLYKVAGEGLPGVFHVAARTLTSHALSIFGDHSDVMACRATGVAMLASGTPQEVMDLSPVSHLSAIQASMPFMNFFDGFRTSHEIQKLRTWEYEDLRDMLDWDAVAKFRAEANTPHHPYHRGSNEPPETFFQHREASNTAYNNIVDVVVENMNKVNAKIGTNYKPFNYYGAPDATDVIVAMGSVCGTLEEVVDVMTAQGKKVGIIEVHLYRPFSAKHFLSELPDTVQRIAVLDRTKEPGAFGEPLYLDVTAVLNDAGRTNIKVIGGRYGLSSKDTTPDDMYSVFMHLAKGGHNHFTVSIVDDVTHLSIEKCHMDMPHDPTQASVKFWGIGSDGLVGASKNTSKIIGDHTDKYVQAYFQYDSKKSGGLTISHLRFGDKPIRSSYYVGAADCVVCGNPAYIGKYDMVRDIKPGGIFMLNCDWEGEELEARLPANIKREIARKNIKFYTCDAVNIARKIGLKGRINTIIQSAYFKLADLIPAEDAIEYMKQGIINDYGAKGQNIVDMNVAAVMAGQTAAKEVTVPASWADAKDEAKAELKLNAVNKQQEDYVRNILIPTNNLEGDALPVSAFMDYTTGKVPSGTSAFEKRGIAVDIPVWHAENCTQCNWCSAVCPHAVIRPAILNPEDAEKIGVATADCKTAPGKKFVITVSAYDCTGCGSCVEMCPAHNKALSMELASGRMEKEQEAFEFAKKAGVQKGSNKSVKTSQFLRPYLEYSGACPGCGETPYAKMVSQLFGDHAVIANATGCSSIWGASVPSMPYVVDEKGRGPAWANSLFEDNAEFGYGMAVSLRTRRNEMKAVVERLAADRAFAGTAGAWLKKMNTSEAAGLGEALVELCKVYPENKDAAYVIENADMLPRPSMWLFGGDGWAYDIGYGGLDHIIASRENFNILVFDTEVYSNTGGQSSKATPTGAVAQFAAGGKPTGKKDLAQIAMTYGHVYVAQVAMGANPAQTLKALVEAESYDGPSLIIAYAPCINHGIKAGMNRSMVEMKKAVRSGYWNLLRFDPRLAAEGKNPLQIDSAKPNEDYKGFLKGEVRYASLALKNPERAEALFEESQEAALGRYTGLINRRDSLEPKEGQAK
ncbi:MAG: pyruvate:ferredoxin (flavodoxin) oxidoreductase [Evtepia sp.]|uniref:pyruvate:ferredoxin (flavodoxin) oxidoreductase n=1 Tax=Evtepia sp. TaxID=2773933 RepID=UPI002A75DBEB|nr:pyruvate:ferredoxin (flavodoxin) oxidoreductase [Evtepia sp.]MDY3014059.1 pyruvate:ferredoxin (flavodoxin) oxidoreductase [Evtepia sp.]